jgi:hypothetical protein
MFVDCVVCTYCGIIFEIILILNFLKFASVLYEYNTNFNFIKIYLLKKLIGGHQETRDAGLRKIERRNTNNQCERTMATMMRKGKPNYRYYL